MLCVGASVWLPARRTDRLGLRLCVGGCPRGWRPRWTLTCGRGSARNRVLRADPGQGRLTSGVEVCIPFSAPPPPFPISLQAQRGKILLLTPHPSVVKCAAFLSVYSSPPWCFGVKERQSVLHLLFWHCTGEPALAIESVWSHCVWSVFWR